MKQKSPLHVLVTADTVGGVWTYTRELVTGLCERGSKVTLVSFGEIPTAEQTEWLEPLADVDFRPTAFRLEWMQDAEADLEVSAEFLLSVVADVKPDLLHLNQFFYGDLKCEVPRIVVGHSDVIGWWQSVHGSAPKTSKFTRWYRQVVERGIASADAVVAPTQWMLASLKQNYGQSKLASVIYNGRTAKLFNPHLSKLNTAISVGRIWDFGKNAALLTHIEPPMPIYLVGSEQNPDANGGSNSLVDAEGRKRLICKGQQSEIQLRQLLGRAAIYVGTSQYEPFGLAPLEAALSRCALVLSDIQTFKELWGENAFYFRNNDPKDLERALLELHLDADLRATYGKLAFDHARRRFTADRMVSDYLDLYNAVVGEESVAA